MVKVLTKNKYDLGPTFYTLIKKNPICRSMDEGLRIRGTKLVNCLSQNLTIKLLVHDLKLITFWFIFAKHQYKPEINPILKQSCHRNRHFAY